MNVNQIVLESTGASSIVQTSNVQSLWSDYGMIKRMMIKGTDAKSVIVKHIKLPGEVNHPKGWNTDISHQRKLQSYQVEQTWYQEYANKTDRYCRVPKIFHTSATENELLLVMEDLDESGYDIRIHHNNASLAQAKNCLTWLAHFHAKFIGHDATGLWPIGSYWHLDTRPEELKKMNNQRLKEAAKDIDGRLNSADFQTLVHGDAKLANFCFNANDEVSGVDFQYVGKGCGMKDVVYFISSCFEEDDCERYETEFLNCYFSQLALVIDRSIDFLQLKVEWRELYKYAWADFYRFLDGWSPGHWKMHGYSDRITQEVLNEIDRS